VLTSQQAAEKDKVERDFSNVNVCICAKDSSMYDLENVKRAHDEEKSPNTHRTRKEERSDSSSSGGEIRIYIIKIKPNITRGKGTFKNKNIFLVCPWRKHRVMCPSTPKSPSSRRDE